MCTDHSRGQYDGSLWYKIAEEVEAQGQTCAAVQKAKWQ
jgi:hypothetical protein